MNSTNAELLDDYDIKKLYEYIKNDKKILNDIINIVVVDEIGSAYIEKYTLKEFKDKIEV